jgi:Protein of unknown function (DUF3352)
MPDPSKGETVTATQTSAPAPAWRVAVIAIVAALAVGIGIAAGAFLMGARSAAIGSGASYVPATAPIYFEVRLEPSEAQDAALREFLGRFPEIEGVDLSQPLYSQLTEMLDEQIAASGTDLSWSEDVDPWFDGRVGVAMLEFPAAALDPTMSDPEMFGSRSAVVLVAITDAAAAQSSLDRILAESEVPLTFTEQEHAGVTIHVEEQSSLAYAITDDQLLFATTADDIVAALDAHATSSTTLSEAGSITALTDALPEEWLLFGIYDFTDVLASAFEGPAAASPGADVMRDLLAGQPMRGAMALTVEGDRISLPMTSDAPTGPFTVANADRGLAEEVPGDALYYAEGGNVGKSLSGVVQALKESLASVPDVAGQLDMVEAALGGDIEDQVAWIGDLATVGGYDGEQPWGGAIIVPTDMEQARRTMDRLSTFAGLATLDPSIGITVEERDVDSVEITSLRWQDPNATTEPDPAMPFSPPEVVVEWAITDDRVLLGVGDRFVERALGQDAAGSLAENAGYRDAVADLGGPTNAGVTWIDLRGLRLALEPVIGEMDPAGMEMYEAEIVPWLEPLDRFVSVVRVEGDLLRTDAVLLVD